MFENYQELANAIIIQASRDYIDYFEALKKLKMVDAGRLNKVQKSKLEAKIKAAEADLNEVKRFFRSDWCRMLTSLDPESILNRLEMEVAA